MSGTVVPALYLGCSCSGGQLEEVQPVDWGHRELSGLSGVLAAARPPPPVACTMGWDFVCLLLLAGQLGSSFILLITEHPPSILCDPMFASLCGEVFQAAAM